MDFAEIGLKIGVVIAIVSILLILVSFLGFWSNPSEENAVEFVEGAAKPYYVDPIVWIVSNLPLEIALIFVVIMLGFVFWTNPF